MKTGKRSFSRYKCKSKLRALTGQVAAIDMRLAGVEEVVSSMNDRFNDMEGDLKTIRKFLRRLVKGLPVDTSKLRKNTNGDRDGNGNGYADGAGDASGGGMKETNLRERSVDAKETKPTKRNCEVGEPFEALEDEERSREVRDVSKEPDEGVRSEPSAHAQEEPSAHISDAAKASVELPLPWTPGNGFRRKYPNPITIASKLVCHGAR
ncbi:uncharacterized protein LOC111018527 [Momordica charantia]|uniref:Uncharacterized protein LOC111018527 n=1 Tax=Momordica charantia TaxID=3673 RepID=A0A6J1D868_MOMCH|nr:uncharacterized protein LOC111018527 [Momordica charantia]XP_022150330.1 uncharacterized protein LOC111018527 [Momordica charantia]